MLWVLIWSTLEVEKEEKYWPDTNYLASDYYISLSEVHIDYYYW